MESYTGIVDEIIFANEDNGYTVMALDCDGDLVICTGNIGTVFEGEKLTVFGTWFVNPLYGKQLRIEQCKKEVPETAAEMLAFLSSGLIKGVREKLAMKIIKRFGSDTFRVIAENPEALAKVEGITKEKAKNISKAFIKLNGEREAIIGLEKYGLTASECLKIYKELGAGCVQLVEDNPYVLCGASIGIGFSKAAMIESKLPTPIPAEYKIQAFIISYLKYQILEGHTCMPVEEVSQAIIQQLGITDEQFKDNIIELINGKKLVGEKLYSRDFIFLPEMYSAEKNIAKDLIFHKHFIPKTPIDIDKEISKAELIGSVVYNDKQRLAIKIAAEKGILVLTGGPGTGKTTTLRGILRVLESQGLEVALAAPTGRAAKRMSTLTGKEAKTIHRLLEVEWDDEENSHFKKNRRNPISAKAVILDELSMVDVNLFSALLAALPIGCRLIMVGDSNQLPAVGAGNVLHDIISSNVLPVVELTEVFRQAMESLIISNAHKIVKGDYPELSKKDKDFFYMERSAPQTAAQTIAELCFERLPKAYKLDKLNDIQVLCPSKKGQTGTVSLNKLLQGVLNPPSKAKKEHIYGDRVFRVNDKVMQTKNNYDIEWSLDGKLGTGIFNGDIGLIEKIDEIKRVMYVKFDDRLAAVPFENLIDIEHAYAITVHKSQGSEFNCVIIPVVGVNPMLTYRNLFYTAVTRAKNILILVGTRETVYAMVNNDKKQKRFSALLSFLKS